MSNDKTFAVHVGFFDGWTHGVVAIHASDSDTACRKALNQADTDPDFFDLVNRTDVVEGMPVFVAGVEEIADPDDVRTIPTPADGEPDDTGQTAVMARYYAGQIIEEQDRFRRALDAIRARTRGEWDNANLAAAGPLSPNYTADVLRIAEDALPGFAAGPAPAGAADLSDLTALLREAVPFLVYLAVDLENPKPAESLLRRIEAALGDEGSR